MNWLESLVYGFVSGISEFLPISSSAHQLLLLHIFGVNPCDPARDLFVHLALLLAIISSAKTLLEQIRRERSINYRNSSAFRTNSRALWDWRLIRGAILPQVFAVLILQFAFNVSNNLLIATLLLAINGLIIFIPERIVQGNKDARSMSAFDAFLIGAAGGFSVFYGISRIACTYSASVIRGAAKKHAITWSLVLSIYALACFCCIDVIGVISGGAPNFWTSFYSYILSGITAYLGGCISIAAVRFLITRPSNYGFAYYCWGCSLFMFILYLTIA